MTTAQTLQLLRQYESRNVTFVENDGSWPIVWERAQGVYVWDTEGKRYLDLTAAFGVAAAGHANPRVVRAGQKQMARLLHAMGDVHPHALKAQLARELSRITFERWTQQSKVQSPKSRVTGAQSTVHGPQSASQSPKSGRPAQRAELRSVGKAIFCNSGFEAVEAALKTALLATGKPGIIAFKGAYHGVGYGALNATHRHHFRSPFRRQLREFASFVSYLTVGQASSLSGTEAEPTQRPDPSSILAPVPTKIEAEIRQLFRHQPIGAILVEPIQVRGGINIPPLDFLVLLRKLCDEFQALLILDEIYTGFGRTGKWFACEHSGIVPDLICLGKALTGGFPLSACIGRADLMDAAWPASTGEAIHTSTFLGHPVGCAMALAQIAELETHDSIPRSALLGEFLLSRLQAIHQPSTLRLHARGLGLLAGLELRTSKGVPATATALTAIKAMLASGYILLLEGEYSNVISFTPPLTISQNQLAAAVGALAKVLS